ncbi:MAG: hypothetical protein J6386_16890 [Candidatus Synoicihabitans palmerolidicus]|nr:hypothetical protein [Candidatus Synoicihabitans palmerolidicus]
MAALVGLSMVTSNTFAVARGLLGRATGVFERTPKSRAGERTVYRVKLDGRWWAELGLAWYLSGAMVYAALSPSWWWAMPMGIYATASWLGVLLQVVQMKSAPSATVPVSAEAKAAA